MDKHVSLMRSLQTFAPSEEKEAADLAAMIVFLQSGQECFVRTNPWAHFTGSALLVNHAGDKVLLNHHRATGVWLQFGGHADGNPDLMDVARRELEEESGFTKIESVMPGIFDVDIHPVPYRASRQEPAHLHYDVRYLYRLTTDDEQFKISDESLELRWCDYDQAIALTGPGSVARMLRKWAKS